MLIINHVREDNRSLYQPFHRSASHRWPSLPNWRLPLSLVFLEVQLSSSYQRLEPCDNHLTTIKSSSRSSIVGLNKNDRIKTLKPRTKFLKTRSVEFNITHCLHWYQYLYHLDHGLLGSDPGLNANVSYPNQNGRCKFPAKREIIIIWKSADQVTDMFWAHLGGEYYKTSGEGQL